MARAAVLGRLNWQLAEIVATIPETPTVTSLRMRVPDWPGHLPGQHVDVRLTAEDGYQAQRSYSIASPPEQSTVDLTIERLIDGEVSPYLTDEVRPGDRLELRGPIGGYFTWTADRVEPLLLIGGGSGVVPLMAMIRHRAAAGGIATTTLLASFHSAEEIIYREELTRLAGADPTLRVVLTLTRAQPPDWAGYRRWIDPEMLEEVIGVPERRHLAYICGPTRLVENVATDLLTMGFAAHRVKTERFGPTGG